MIPRNCSPPITGNYTVKRGGGEGSQTERSVTVSDEAVECRCAQFWVNGFIFPHVITVGSHIVSTLTPSVGREAGIQFFARALKSSSWFHRHPVVGAEISDSASLGISGYETDDAAINGDDAWCASPLPRLSASAPLGDLSSPPTLAQHEQFLGQMKRRLQYNNVSLGRTDRIVPVFENISEFVFVCMVCCGLCEVLSEFPAHLPKL